MSRDLDRRLILALLAVCVGLLGLLVVGLLFPAPPELAPGTHPDHAAMQQSGEGAPGGPLTRSAGFAMGLLVVALAGLLSLVCVRREARGLRNWVVVTFVGYGLVFSLLMLSYHGFLEAEELDCFGGFPTPTAWMLYGMVLFPWILVLGYTLYFERSYYTREDEKRFQDLMRSREQG